MIFIVVVALVIIHIFKTDERQSSFLTFYIKIHYMFFETPSLNLIRHHKNSQLMNRFSWRFISIMTPNVKSFQLKTDLDLIHEYICRDLINSKFLRDDLHDWNLFCLIKWGNINWIKWSASFHGRSLYNGYDHASSQGSFCPKSVA